MKLSINEVSSLRSADLKRIKINVTEYYLSNLTEFKKNISVKEYHNKIELGLKCAIRYGLNTEYSLIKYLGLMLKLTNRFDEQPDIRRILADEEQTANTKIDAVVNKLNINNDNDARIKYNL